MVCLNFRFLSYFKRVVFLSLFFSFSYLAVTLDSKQQMKARKKVTKVRSSNITTPFVLATKIKSKNKKGKVTISVKPKAGNKSKKGKVTISVKPKAGVKSKEGRTRVTASNYGNSKFNIKDKEEEQKARGLVIRYHKWPSLKQQKEVSGILKSSGLERTKSIKSFKAQLFGWTNGGLKASKLGEKACLKLKRLSYVKRCSPDHLLPMNQNKRSYLTNNQLSKTKVNKNNKVGYMLEQALASSNIKTANTREKANKKEVKSKLAASKKTEAGSVVECEECKNKELEELKLVSQKALNLRTCNIISHKRDLMEGELSDYWAQELIGSDLMREELKKTALATKKENWIAVFDSEENDHNIAVKNLISDEGPHAVLPELEKKQTPFSDVSASVNDSSYKEGKGYKSALNLYETSYPGDYLFGFRGNPPRYINNSMNWFNSEDIYDVFKNLSTARSQVITIGASGNAFPKRLDDMEKKASKDFDVILVGSLAPDGFVSDFSQSGKEVSILAPSDHWLTSAGGRWDNKPFGGTSGAAPLVTGSLAGFEWLSGYHPTAKEAKILLEKTALPTLHSSFEKPRINGAGLLNAYKLGEVAKRLKKKCKNKSLFCFKEEILNDENYRFAEDKSLRKDLERVFPSCSGGEPSESSVSSCEEKKELFIALRKELLLNPTREYYESLSCLYEEAGFSRNAEALNKLSLALGEESEVRAEIKAMLAKEELVSGDDILRLAIGMGGFEEDFNDNELMKGIKTAGGMGEAGLPLLKRGFETGNPKLQEFVLKLARKMGEVGLPLIERAFETGNLELQEVAVYSAARIGEAGLPLIERGFDTGKLELQRHALNAAGWIREAGLPLIERGFDTGKLELQRHALNAAGIIGEAGLPLVERGFDTGKLELQRHALNAAGIIGEAGLPLVERAFETGNFELQRSAIFSVGRIGEAGLPLIERGFDTGKLELQKGALYSAGMIGEAGLPLLERGFDTGKLELQKRALYSAGIIGEAGLPLIERGFETGNFNLQKAAFLSTARLGEAGLPLLERVVFDTGNLELQKQGLALVSEQVFKHKAIPFLEKVLENENLDKTIKTYILTTLEKLKSS